MFCLQHRLDTLMFFSLRPNARRPLHLTLNSPQLFVSYPALHSLDPGPTVTFSLFLCLLETMFCFEHPHTDTSMLFSLSRHQAPCFCLTRPVYIFFSAGAGVVGLVWGFCALPDLILPLTLRKPISKAIRQPDIRQPDNPTIRKPINPKQGKAQPGPPNHGETTMARANGMSQDRSTYPRNVQISNRESEPGTSISAVKNRTLCP